MIECPRCLASCFGGGERACPFCGAALGPEAPEAPGRPPAAPPEAPVSEEALQFRKQFEERSVHVPERALRRAEEILASAETQLRRATVLIADLRGFSRMAREAPPEDLSRLAAEFYDVCARLVVRRGGFVVKFLGDAVLAVFGAPVAFDRDAESAARAALDIRDWAEQTASGAERPMEVSIGLATGEVHSGRIEGPAGKAYDILGEAANLAARLQGAAGRNEILACAETWAAVRRRFRAEPTPPLVLHNIAEDYVAYRIVEESEPPPPGGREFETPFCGREKELAALEAFLAAPPRAETHVAHVVGEAGMGKTRLVHEALRRSGVAAARVVWWEGSPSCVSVLLWPVMQFLRQEMGLAADDTPAVAQQAIRRWLAERLTPEEGDPLLLEYLFGIPHAVAALQGMPPERIQKNLFALLRAVLTRRGAAGGTILAADDAQWADPLTAAFLRQLMEWPAAPAAAQELPDGIATGALTLVLVYRPNLAPPFPPSVDGSGAELMAAAPDHLCIRLEDLSEADRQALLRRLTPTEEFLPEIRGWVLSRASGNPLFLEEMTRLVREVMRNNAGLNGEALRNRIVEAIPATLRDLIQSRIDRLEVRTRQTLQCASLLGLHFALSLIELFDSIREGLTAHLQALCAFRYLEQRPEARELRFLFTHGLFRDVAYSTLLEEQKRRLHAALARRLEEVFADRLQEYCELLAFHFARGAESQRAIYYLVKAADRQAGLGASSNALQNYAEAIELMRALPPAEARQALMARILTRCGRLHRTLGDGDQADETLGAALDLARALGNERLALEAELEMAVTLLWRGQFDEARVRLQALAREASRLSSPRAEMVALNSLGVIHMQRGEYEEALRAFQTLAGLAERGGAPQIEADAFNNAGLIYWRWGQSAQAFKAYRRALPLRRRANDNFGLCATLMNIAIIEERVGKVRAARKSYENALRLAERTGYAQGLAALEANLSNLERRVGTAASALERAARAVEYARAAGDPVLQSIAEENAGLACAARGEGAAARAHLERAQELAQAHGAHEQRINAQLGLMELACAESAVAPRHVAEINELLAQIEQRGHADLTPRAFRVKARILEALDVSNERTAREYLELARDRARDSGDFFEELEGWQALLGFLERQGESAEADLCRRRVNEMESILDAETASLR